MSATSLRKCIDYKCTFNSHPHAEEIFAMIDAAKNANVILRKWFDQAKQSEDPETFLGTQTKSDTFKESGFHDALTHADTESEEHVIALLKKCRDIPIVAEERGHSVPDETIPNGGMRWLIDPLDGTYCFKNGEPDFSVTIALQKKVGGKWRTLIGAISDPMHDEIYLADQNEAFLIQDNREKRLTLNVQESAAFSGSLDQAFENKKIEVCLYNEKNDRLNKTRIRVVERMEEAASSTFSTAKMIAKIADGWLDGAIVGGNGALANPWDTDAAIHIAQKAGAVVKRTEIDDEPVVYIANSRSLLRALEEIVSQEYRSQAPNQVGG